MTTLLVVLYIAVAIAHVPLFHKIMLDGDRLSDQEGFYLFTYVALMPVFTVFWPLADVFILLVIACLALAEGIRWSAKKLNI